MNSAVMTMPSGLVAAFYRNWKKSAVTVSGVTVVICTYCRPSSVIRLLESLYRFEGVRYPILVVDASPDAQTEAALWAWCTQDRKGCPLSYVRVEAALRGLTKQRNLALRLAETELICFFDDDLELLSDSVTEMLRVFCKSGGELIGVSSLIVNQPRHPTWLWRLRRALAITADLRPGSYQGSGFSVPWGYVEDRHEVVLGDWLPGGATLWDASRARTLGFCEAFSTYAQSEDLEFSLRIGRTGKLALATRAHVAHLHAPDGREQPFRLGYMAIRNRYYVHRRRFTSRRVLYTLWFIYAWSLDTVMLSRHIAIPGRMCATLQNIAGRVAAAADLLAGRPDRLLAKRASVVNRGMG
jgi:GT2 family glycosyltransferase